MGNSLADWPSSIITQVCRDPPFQLDTAQNRFPSHDLRPIQLLDLQIAGLKSIRSDDRSLPHLTLPMSLSSTSALTRRNRVIGEAKKRRGNSVLYDLHPWSRF